MSVLRTHSVVIPAGALNFPKDIPLFSLPHFQSCDSFLELLCVVATDEVRGCFIAEGPITSASPNPRF